MDTVENKLLKALEQYPSLRPVVKYNMAVTPCGHFFSLVTGDEVFVYRKDGLWTITAGYIEKTGNPAKIMCEAFHGPRPDKYFAFTIDPSKPITVDNVEWRKAGTDKEGKPFWNVARKWWNNGIKNTRATECPGPEWVRGRLFSKEHVEQIKKSRSDNLSGLLTRKTYNTPDGPMTYYEYAERHNIRPTTAYQRIHKFNNPGPQKVYINTDGKTYGTLRELAEACNTGIASQHQRLKKGIIKKEYR